jgi:2-dehydropantoate 2-reductase
LKIAIMGTGGVGGLFGARLAKAGCDVTFIARGAHLQAIKKNGLKILSEHRGDIHLPDAKATDSPADIGVVDFVFFTVKLWDTETAAHAIKPLIGDNTAVISFQNGVQRDEVLSSILGRKHVVGGISYVASFIEEPGVVCQRGFAQKLVFGEYSGERSKRVEDLAIECASAEIEADIPPDIQIALWEKFVFLVAMSSVTAATRQRIGPVRSEPHTRKLLIDVMREAIAVGRAKRVPIGDDLIDRQLAYVDGLAPDVTASMQQDLSKGNRLELPWLSGAVVELGSQLNVPTSVNETLYAVLSPYVMGSN